MKNQLSNKPSTGSKRIIMFCAKYNRAEQGVYLTNDLAEALRRLGHYVQVVVIQWDADPNEETERYMENGVQILRCSPKAIGKNGSLLQRISKWVYSSVGAMGDVKRELEGQNFDLVIAFGPIVTTLAPVRWALRTFNPRSYAYNPDFFPFYHRSIGLVPGGPIFALAYLAEWKALRWFDVIGVMSPVNVTFLRRKFPLRAGQRTSVLHLWGDTSLVPDGSREERRRRFDLPTDRSIALFGGQLVEGRGIEDILAAAKLAQTLRPDLLFLFVGQGRLQPLVEAYIQGGGTNVRLMKPVGRDDYLALAAACDVGINATASHVVVPTFPTKTIDYVRARLPIAAAVERASDYGDFVGQAGIGKAVPSGDPDALLRVIENLVDDHDAAALIRAAGPSALARYFDVDGAAAAIVADSFPESEALAR